MQGESMEDNDSPTRSATLRPALDLDGSTVDNPEQDLIVAANLSPLHAHGSILPYPEGSALFSTPTTL